MTHEEEDVIRELYEAEAEFGRLVSSHLRLDWLLVREVDVGPHRGDHARASKIGAGLQNLLLRTLTTHLVLRCGDGPSVRLETAETARAKGFPNAEIANFCLALAWGLSYEDRMSRRLPRLTVLAAVPGTSGSLQPAILPDFSMEAINEMVAKTLNPASGNLRFRPDPECGPSDGETQPGALDSLSVIRDLLHLDPHAFVGASGGDRARRGSPKRRRVAEAAHAGLCRLVRSALQQYALMRQRDAMEVRLLSEDQARTYRQTDARTANYFTILACGLHGSAGAGLEVLPARDSALSGPKLDFGAFTRDVAIEAIKRWVMEDGTLHSCQILARAVEDCLYVDPDRGDTEAAAFIESWGPTKS